MIKKILLVASSILMISCCASFINQSGPDYAGLYGRVARAMNQQVRPMTPPIVFVQDSTVLGQMFPQLTKPGEHLLGVYWGGMVYLSQEDLSELVVAHEFSHYLGANERTAEIVSEACTRPWGTFAAGNKKLCALADLITVTVGSQGTLAAGVRSPVSK